MTTEQREPLYASTAKPWLKYYDQKYIDMPLPKCSAFEYLCHQNKNHLSETALEYYGRKFTFADLFVNVKKTAAAFRALGVKKGDIITVVSVMTPEVIYAFYAVDMIGATLNLVDPRYSVEGIHEYIEEVDSRLLICLNVTYERCHKAEKRTNVERVLVICGYMVLFSSVGSVIASFAGPVSGLAALLLADLPSGLAELAAWSFPGKMLIQGVAIGFAGLCIAAQNLDVLRTIGVRPGEYLAARGVAAGLFGCISGLVLRAQEINLTSAFEKSGSVYAISLAIACIFSVPGLIFLTKNLFLNKEN